MDDEDEYAIQIVGNEVKIHNISAEERMKKRKLAIRKAKIKAKRKFKHQKREQRKIKAEKRLRNERNEPGK